MCTGIKCVVVMCTGIKWVVVMCTGMKWLKVAKTLFIVPTDAHYYKNHRMLKQFKITHLF
jgi:hypothetical protein